MPSFGASVPERVRSPGFQPSIHRDNRCRASLCLNQRQDHFVRLTREYVGLGHDAREGGTAELAALLDVPVHILIQLIAVRGDQVAKA